MNELKGAGGELCITGTIISKETGKAQPYQLVGFVDAEKLKALQDAGLLPKPEESKCP